MILTPAELAIERAASLKRTRPQREAAEVRLREILQRADATVAAGPLNWSQRQRARKRRCPCGRTFLAPKTQGAPPKFCPRCRR